ncbi:MAG: hypothetical protein B0A82_08300 [Alkalinema sp. CACIAM 70d]|nr:MAG: hypothetical protein B0A82_08300 [Alkalinema sp. CACIAM 70d]
MNGADDPQDTATWDQSLKQLAIAAQQQPANSLPRQRILARLIDALQKSKKLTRPLSNFSGAMYEEIYAEALQRLYLYICQRIDSYRSEQAEVLQWVNFLLKRRFFPEATREIMGKTADQQRFSLDDLDHHFQVPEDSSPSDELRQYLEEDPDRLFQTVHVQKYPKATFQYIALQRLAGFSWQEITLQLNVDVPTLSSFYQRRLKEFTPYFRAYLSS